LIHPPSGERRIEMRSAASVGRHAVRKGADDYDKRVGPGVPAAIFHVLTTSTADVSSS
jgi:hypothetical protein